MRSRRVHVIAALVRRLTLATVLSAALTLTSLHAFDREYGAAADDRCASPDCAELGPALAEIARSQQDLGRQCTTTPRLSGVVAVDDGRGGARLTSLTALVAANATAAPRTAIFCR